MNALFITFNNDYIPYAKGAIKTFLRYHPGWMVHCLAVNCKYSIDRDSFFSNTAIKIHHHKENFAEHGMEREYCNSRRFCHYLSWLEQYDKVITTDCDILFKENLSEIIQALDSHDMAMYYQDKEDIRNKAGASFIAFRNCLHSREFLSTYTKHLNSLSRNWWNDQICLAKAYEEISHKLTTFHINYEDYCYSGLDTAGIERCHVIQPRGDKKSDVLAYYRTLLDKEVSGKAGHDKILIIGSGLSAEKCKDWNLKGWHIIAINHAWQIRDDWDELIHPNDYVSPLPNKIKPNQHIVDCNTYMKTNLAFGVQDVRGNSMIFQALYYALGKLPRVIGTIGCDLYYPPGEKTHFYGKGTPDPLRLGEATLRERFERVKEIARKNNVELYNFSGESRGFNTLEQKIFEYSVIKRRPMKVWKHIKKHLSGRKPRPAMV